MNKILSIFGTVSSVIIGIWALYLFFLYPHPEGLRDLYYAEFKHCIVDSIYNDKWNHDACRLLVKTDHGDVDFYATRNYYKQGELCKFLRKGDTLEKAKYSYDFIRISNNKVDSIPYIDELPSRPFGLFFDKLY